MLATERMAKIELITPKTKAYAVIELLQKLQLMHLVDHQKTTELDIGSSLAGAEEIASLLLKIRSLLAIAKEQKLVLQNYYSKDYGLDNITQRIKTLQQLYDQNRIEIRQVTEKLADAEALVSPLELLNTLYMSIESYKPYNSLAVFLGTVRNASVVKQSVPKKSMCYTSTWQGKDIIAVFVKKDQEQEIAKLLMQYQFQALDISRIIHLEGLPSTHLMEQEKVRTRLRGELQHLQEQSKGLLNKELLFLQQAEEALSTEAEKREIPLRCAATQQTIIANGWVAEKKLAILKQELEKKTKGAFHLEIKEISHSDKVPILFNNPRFARPVEFFLNLFTLPDYHELDPTVFMFFTFPLFFGLMLGDIGYGIVTLALFWYLQKKLPEAKQLLTVMIYCSLVSIFFGFFFGEVFGFEHLPEGAGIALNSVGISLERVIVHNEIVYDIPRVMNRLHGEITILGNTLPSVLVLGGILGVIHINMGLLFGFINELHHHGFKHALFAKASWYLVELAVALLTLSGLKLIPLPLWLGFVVLGVAISMLYKGEGIQGLVELPAIFSNILSYFRLAAVGLASVGLAVVVNEDLVAPFMEKGGIFIILGIIIFILGHAINIALGILGPFLHSLRLHYVEFFSKFYKGGGILFVAFGRPRKKG